MTLLTCVLTGGCALLYPEVKTPLRDLPKGVDPKPAPPKDLLYIRFAEVVIPERTRDGRLWDQAGGSLPDPIARLIVGDRTIVVETPVEKDTLVATWPDQIDSNYFIKPNSKVRVEVWDRNTLVNGPICIKPVESLHEEAEFGELRLRCDGGTRITLTVEQARAHWGLGMTYEVGERAARITSVYRYSPVVRGGLAEGDEITAVDGVQIATMDAEQVASAINAKSRNGIRLQVRTAIGRTRELTLKEGPIYITDEELRLGSRRRGAAGD